MSIVERIKRDLQTSCYTAIFEFSETEKSRVNEVKGYLKEDNGYLDIILDDNDFRGLTKNIDRIETMDLRWFYIQQNLFDIIVNKFGLKDAVLIDYKSLADALNEFALKQGKNGFRIHIFLDDVKRPSLQVAINDLINSGVLNVMCYLTEPLKTYKDSQGDSIYGTTFITSQAKIYEIRNKFKDLFKDE
ncbi:MAG: hypothetical protein IKH36_02410 [Bacilli bacterium]|nr:hypothetical protein [Bacilli bacterium]